MSYTLVLEPSVAAWRGPQRLVLQVDAERVVDAEYRPSYGDNSLATRINRIGLETALHEVARSCATCAHAHSLAFCQAIELLLGLEITPRAAALRVVVAELERAASHLGTLAALFATMGVETTARSLGEQRAVAQAGLALVAGDANGPPLFLPGGLRRDLADTQRGELRQSLAGLGRRLFQLADKVIDQRLILARTVEIGLLGRDAATQFRLSGPLARASGLQADLRIDKPYAAYAMFQPQLVTQEGGDVYARLVVLLLEALESVKLADRALGELPDGPWARELPTQVPEGSASAVVEAPRGALRYTVEGDGQRLSALSTSVAPQLDRLLARTLLKEANLDDSVLIALSTDPCSACAELETP